MSLKEWIKQGPLRRDNRRAPRMGLHQEALACRLLDGKKEEPEKIELLDFSSGGLKVCLSSPIEIGQTVWIRTTVRHVEARDDGAIEAGVTWES